MSPKEECRQTTLCTSQADSSFRLNLESVNGNGQSGGQVLKVEVENTIGPDSWGQEERT